MDRVGPDPVGVGKLGLLRAVGVRRHRTRAFVRPNRFGGGDLLSTLTFLVAYPGAILAPIAMILLARGAFAVAANPAGESASRH
jgi:hypothetical protein